MRSRFGRARRASRCEAGSAAIEFGIVGLVLVMLCFGLIEFGRGLFYYNKVAQAADRVARKILIDPYVSISKLEDEMRSAFSSGEQGALAIMSSPEMVDGVAFQRIVVRYSLRLYVPGLVWPNPNNRRITLRAERRVPRIA